MHDDTCTPTHKLCVEELYNFLHVYWQAPFFITLRHIGHIRTAVSIDEALYITVTPPSRNIALRLVTISTNTATGR